MPYNCTAVADYLVLLEKASNPEGIPAVLVCERMRPHLSTLMGKAGFQALLSRAVTLAQARNPELGAVCINASGALDGLVNSSSDSEGKTEACVHVVAELLGLLVAFIGSTLTFQLLQVIWPQLPAGQWEPSKGGAA